MLATIGALFISQRFRYGEIMLRLLAIHAACVSGLVLTLCESAGAQWYCATKPATNVCTPGAAGPSAAAPNVSGLWPTRTVPVVLSGSVKRREVLQAAVRDTLLNVAKFSGYNFFECDETKLKDSTFNYMYIDDTDECQAEVGYSKLNAFQRLASAFKFPKRLVVEIGASRCDAGNQAGIAHEIMHRLGVEHEQGHPDRSKYLTVKRSQWLSDPGQFIAPAWGVGALRFDKEKFVDTYDILSVMHYPFSYFDEVKASTPNAATPFSKFIEDKYVKSKLAPSNFSFDSSRSFLGQNFCVSSDDAKFLQYLASGIEPALPCDGFKLVSMTDACHPVQASKILAVASMSPSTEKPSVKARTSSR